MATKHSVLKTVQSFEEVPPFVNEAEEAEFWSTHDLSKTLLDRMGSVPDDLLPPPRSRTKPVSIRFDEDTIRRVKALAQAKHKGYQTLLKEFVVERLYEEEKRAGLVGR